MNRRTISLLVFLVISINTYAQISINNDNSDPDGSAMLDIKSTDKGILIPRMTTAQRGLISSPALGLLIFDTDTESFWFRESSGWVELGASGDKDKITDDDGDTNIQVEASSDEDKIRFDLGGTEYFVLDSGRIEVRNTGYSTFLGEEAGASDDLSGQANTFIGNQSGKSTTGYTNVGLGAFTMTDNVSGNDNTAVGNLALNRNVIGSKNVAVGTWALQWNTNSVKSVAIGVEAGRNAMGQNNVLIGYRAGRTVSGDNKLYIENSGSNSPLIYGEFDNDFLRFNGNVEVRDSLIIPTGASDGYFLRSDSTGKAYWSSGETLIQDTDKDTKIQVEESADEDKIRFEMGGTEYFVLDSGRIGVYNTGSSTLLGMEAGESDDLSGLANTFIGYRAGKNTEGNANLGLGAFNMVLNESGSHNTALGYFSMLNNATGSKNVAIGSYSLFHNPSSENNVAIGFEAGRLNAGNHNVLIGYQAGYYETGDNKLYIENSNSQIPLIYGEFDNDFLRLNANVEIRDSLILPTGASDGYFLRSDSTGKAFWSAGEPLLIDTDNDTKIQVEESADEDKIRFDLGGTEHFVFEEGRILFKGSGNFNSIFLGDSAGQNPANYDRASVFIGNRAGRYNLSGIYNTAIGNNVFMENTSGSMNAAIGYRALGENTTGSNNTALGAFSGASNTVGSQNTSLGHYAGTFVSSGSSNVLVGAQAGAGSGPHAKAENVMVGAAAGALNHGDGNLFLGFNAGYYESGSDRLYIENSDSSSPLIYGEFDNNLVRVNGIFNINNAYSFPLSDGNPGQVLETDGAGNLTWNDNDEEVPTGGSNGQVLSTDGSGNLSWVDKGNTIPVGTIQMYVGNTAPAGWLICDGTSISSTNYPALYSVLGGTGSGSISLPNFKGRFPLGQKYPVSPGQTPYQLKSTGGEEEVTLTTSQIPSHTHGVTITYREGSENGNGNDYSDLGGGDGNSKSYTSGSTGGGQAHNNMPPYYVVNFIIKAD